MSTRRELYTGTGITRSSRSVLTDISNASNKRSGKPTSKLKRVASKPFRGNRKLFGTLRRKKTERKDHSAVMTMSCDNPMFEFANPSYCPSITQSDAEENCSRGPAPRPSQLSLAQRNVNTKIQHKPPPPKKATVRMRPVPPKISKPLYVQCQNELEDAMDSIKRSAKNGNVNGAMLEVLSHTISVSKARGVDESTCNVLTEAIQFESHMRSQLIAAKSVNNAMEAKDFKRLKKILKRAEKDGIQVGLKFNSSYGERTSLHMNMN